ncbi:MAG: Ig-like domain-containing protein [Lachnospiraceae bacterium]
MKKQIMALACALMLVVSGTVPANAAAKAKPVELSKTSIKLKVGASKAIKVKKAAKVTIKKKTFTSSDSKVAAVTQEGKVTAKKKGKAVIKVEVNYKNGKKDTIKTLKCKVTVTGGTAIKNDKDALKQLIAKQRKSGATVSEDLNNDDEYEWDDNGNLTYIQWSGCSLSGDISFSSFKKLKGLRCNSNKLTSLDVSKNAVLESLSCSSNNLTSLDISKNTALISLSCSSNKLASLDISKNTALETLYCDENNLTSLDVSNNTVLEDLERDSNVKVTKTYKPGTLNQADIDALKKIIAEQKALGATLSDDFDDYKYEWGKYEWDEDGNLTYINWRNCSLSGAISFSGFKNLKRLYCNSNNLTSLYVSDNTSLTYLNCNSNSLASLDVSNITSLTYLSCSTNKLTNLDISKNTALETLYCDENNLASLDVSNNTVLEDLERDSNVKVTKTYKPGTLNQADINALKQIIAEQKALGATLSDDFNDYKYEWGKYEWDEDGNLTYINWRSCSLSGAISFSGFKNLKRLYCNSNNLTSLDVSNITSLTYLNCNSNSLASLDVSNTTSLTYLSCSNNKLTNLDVSKNTALETLYCDENNLASLDVSKNTALEDLECDSGVAITRASK